ncbi:MAG: hypothetical protein U1E73_03080 [Planctomycetota bacterium]
MRKVLEFEGVLTHVPVSRFADGSLTFFGDDCTADAPSVSEIHESPILAWILGQGAVRSLLTRKMCVDSQSQDFLGIAGPVIEKPTAVPGDVDWLAIPPGHPEVSIAVECKRVKVVPTANGRDRVNKIPSLGRGVVQANGLAGLGFHRCFLMVIVEADGRTRTEFGHPFRGATHETFRQIYDFPQRESLHEDVGVVFVEVVQPSGRSIDELAYVAVCVDRDAKPREQSPRVTSRIRSLLTMR